MPASLFETILARVATLLLSATAAGSNVFRGRDDAFDASELPAINIRRGTIPGDSASIHTTAQYQMGFSVFFYAAGAAWETTADALHMQAHALLLADATLAGYGFNLACISTAAEDGSEDGNYGRLEASYEMSVFVSQQDLTTPATTL
ncbi:hypothetical protein [Thiobacillus sp.]|uniref:hypothetical protein n=1 Tax=Thiobacillus sp. TaxID=924 RepID=UPI0017E81CC8|nr:hypothetical protein [Thiobacillus sp.]MBC2731380.1 hypothetical protein [Thiobacillus sp.]MBC2740117.1 hypothetical protein [Thiobacillus sp.]MBC2758329.1 hypothetical protein [Thiobacillus sp.]